MSRPVVLGFALLALACGGGAAEVSSGGPRPLGLTDAVPPLSGVERKALPGVDRERLLAEDAAVRKGEAPMRFAVRQAVRYAPEADGTWATAPDGTLVWRLRIHSKDARSLNFGFTRYRMPAGARLFVYAPDGAELLGPYTEKDNKAHGQLWTPVLQGEDAVIELNLPAAARASLELELTAVNHGYR